MVAFSALNLQGADDKNVTVMLLSMSVLVATCPFPGQAA
jgi:hypothetical protein